MNYKFQEGLHLLNRAGHDEALLKQTLIHFHASLEDFFREQLAIQIQQKHLGTPSWRILISLWEKYRGLSYREKQIILSYNKKRNAVAHGKPMLINRRDVVFYRYFVAEFTEKNRSAQFKHGSIQQLLFETVLKSILGAKSGKKGSSKTYLTAVRNGLLGIFILFSCGIIMITEMLSDVATFFSEDSLTNNTIENTTFEGTLSELSDESTQKTYITVIVIDTQVYDGPGDFYLIKDTVYAGQQFELIDHSWDQNWLEIQLNSTDRGWIRKDTTQ